jgi:hypothetical protein
MNATLTFSIERTKSYNGGTTAKMAYTVRCSDGRSFGTYNTLRRANEEMALYATAAMPSDAKFLAALGPCGK